MQKITWHQQTFWLHPHRFMYWEQEKALILSDVHLGKTGHFRKEGIAVPQQVYQQDLHRLFAGIQHFQPKTLLVVGDLFHSAANREWDWFGRWRHDLAHVDFVLIRGNHDYLPAAKYQPFGIHIVDHLQVQNIHFTHEAPATMPTEDAAFISGHVHPCFLVQSGPRQKLRVPCFHFSAQQCTLPAFSLFTGGYAIKPKKTDGVYAIAGEEILKV